MPPDRFAHRARAHEIPAASRIMLRPASPGPETSGCSPPDSDSSPASRATSAPSTRQHPERPRVVQRLQRRHLHVRELQAEEPPARPQHPPRLGQHRRLVGAVAQPERDRHAIHRAIRQRQPFGIGDQQRRTADQPARQRPIARHLAASTALTSLSSTGPPPCSQPAEARHRRCPPARSSSVRRGRGSSAVTKHVLPRAMNAQRHQVVHQVVARRDAVEHRAHHAAASPPRGTRRKPKSVVSVDAGLSLMRAIYSVPHPNAGTPRGRDRDAWPPAAAGGPRHRARHRAPPRPALAVARGPGSSA